MKYVNTRDGFLSKKKNLFDSLILEESGPFASEIPWGDSLVGRLINSFRRKAAIGYNLTKVKSLLDSFKAELDMLIASSLSRDTQNEFDVLRLKNIFHDLREQCTNDVDEPTKLNTLIGGNQGLWNNQQQNGGDWANILTHGILVDAHDFIQNTMDKETLEKAGIPRDGLLDNMTIFIDDLRRLTVSQGNPIVSRRGFPLNFSNLVNSLSNVRESFILGGYYDFILEGKKSAEKQKGNVTPTGASASPTPEVPAPGVPAPGATPSSTPVTAAPKKDPKKLSQPSNNTRNKIKKLKELANICRTNLQELDTEEKILNNQDAKKFIEVIKSLDEDDLTYLSTQNPNLKIKVDDKEFLLSDAINKFSTSKEISAITTAIPKQKEVLEPKVQAKYDELVAQWKKQQQKAGKTNLSPGQGTRTSLIKQAKLQAGAEPENKEEINQEVSVETSNYRYSGYSSIYEAATASSATFSTVEGAWDKFLEDSRLPDGWLNISQREIDKLVDLTDGYETGKLPLNFNIQLHPDPIIGICRIFKRAHDLYFTPIIPSGRTNGKVSNLTYREYEKLGGVSGQSDPNSPGYGPWAVKKIREQWNDGVLAIIQDQKYRKILSNVRFIVPGSEDANNRTAESKLMRFSQFHKVFEAGETNREPARGGELGDDKKSHGQILFDFINDLLDNKTAANFDEQRRTLLRKYFEPFGFKLPKEDQMNPPGNRNLGPQGTTDDFDKKSLYWKADNNPFSTGTPGNATDFNGPFYALPIKKTSQGHEIIFLHLLRQVNIQGLTNATKKCYFVKFLFNTQANVQKLTNSPQFSGYTISNSWDLANSRLNYVYYGIIMIVGNSNKVSIVYSSVNDGKWSNINGDKDYFTLLGPSDNHELDGKNGKVTVTRAKLYSRDPNNVEKVVETDFCGKLIGENDKHIDNLSLPPEQGSNFTGKLMDELEKEAKNKFQ